MLVSRVYTRASSSILSLISNCGPDLARGFESEEEEEPKGNWSLEATTIKFLGHRKYSLQKITTYRMGNKPMKEVAAQKEEILVMVVPPLDKAYVRWLARDLERIHGFTPKKPQAIEPPEHYIEYMRHSGWLELNLDDPDLAYLFK